MEGRCDLHWKTADVFAHDLIKAIPEGEEETRQNTFIFRLSDFERKLFHPHILVIVIFNSLFGSHGQCRCIVKRTLLFVFQNKFDILQNNKIVYLNLRLAKRLAGYSVSPLKNRKPCISQEHICAWSSYKYACRDIDFISSISIYSIERVLFKCYSTPFYFFSLLHFACLSLEFYSTMKSSILSILMLLLASACFVSAQQDDCPPPLVWGLVSVDCPLICGVDYEGCSDVQDFDCICSPGLIWADEEMDLCIPIEECEWHIVWVQLIWFEPLS